MSDALEVRVARLETAFKYNKSSQAKALEIQAREYNRRLDDLNHEAQRILAVQRQSVSREVFDVKVAEIEKSLRPILLTIALVALMSGIAGAFLVRWLTS